MGYFFCIRKIYKAYNETCYSERNTMDKTLVKSAAGSFVGTVACYATIAVVSTVTKKIERSRRAKRENAHKDAEKK